MRRGRGLLFFSLFLPPTVVSRARSIRLDWPAFSVNKRGGGEDRRLPICLLCLVRDSAKSICLDGRLSDSISIHNPHASPCLWGLTLASMNFNPFSPFFERGNIWKVEEKELIKGRKKGRRSTAPPLCFQPQRRRRKKKFLAFQRTSRH